MSAKAKEFGGKSGKYEIHLIFGDAIISNSGSWHLADLELSFPGDVALDVKPNVDGLRTHIVGGVKPEIKHTFRQPEKRPPAVISNAFTVICLAPFLVMLGLWMKVSNTIAKNNALRITSIIEFKMWISYKIIMPFSYSWESIFLPSRFRYQHLDFILVLVQFLDCTTCSGYNSTCL